MASVDLGLVKPPQGQVLFIWRAGRPMIVSKWGQKAKDKYMAEVEVVQELRAEIDRLSRRWVAQCHETERLKHWRDSLRKAIADDGWFDDE